MVRVLGTADTRPTAEQSASTQVRKITGPGCASGVLQYVPTMRGDPRTAQEPMLFPWSLHFSLKNMSARLLQRQRRYRAQHIREFVLEVSGHIVVPASGMRNFVEESPCECSQGLEL